MIWDEFSSQFCFRDEEDSELSDEEQKQNWPENRPKHTRKRVHQAGKKLFVEIQNSFLIFSKIQHADFTLGYLTLVIYASLFLTYIRKDLLTCQDYVHKKHSCYLQKDL